MRTVFPPDALSVLWAYQNNKFPNTTRVIQQVAAVWRAVLQFSSPHCGISGIERVDVLEEIVARD